MAESSSVVVYYELWENRGGNLLCEFDTACERGGGHQAVCFRPCV